MRSRALSTPQFPRFICTFVVLIFQVLTASCAIAYCPRYKIPTNMEFFRAKFVVLGTVVSERTELDSEGYVAAWDYRVRVEKTYRGDHRGILRIRSENDSGRFPMEKGQKYLLFAIVNEIYLSIDNCGNSALLAEAEDALDGIKQIAQSGPYGEIEGRVQGWNTEGVPDIQIVARNKRKSFFIRTDNDGWFHLQVPPGTYNLKAISSAFKLVPYDLNEDKQQHLVVHRGGCVHLDFDAR